MRTVTQGRLLMGIAVAGMCFLAGCRKSALPAQPTPVLTWAGSSEGSSQAVSSAFPVKTVFEIKNFDKEPFAVSVGKLDVRITKEEAPPLEEMQSILDNAKDCAPKRSSNYYAGLALHFLNTQKKTYVMHLLHPPEGALAGDYAITLLPNTPHYKDLQMFKDEFQLCGVGGSYPFLLNDQWLVFSTSCGNSEACGTVQNVVEPSIRLR